MYALMRNKDDINTAHDMNSICRAALLNNNAPDSELYQNIWSHRGAAIDLTQSWAEGV